MMIKSLVILIGYFACYYLAFFWSSSFFLSLALGVGFFAAEVGVSIQHDGNHGTWKHSNQYRQHSDCSSTVLSAPFRPALPTPRLPPPVLAPPAEKRLAGELSSGESELESSDKLSNMEHYVEFWKHIPPYEPFRVLLGDMRDKLYKTWQIARATSTWRIHSLTHLRFWSHWSFVTGHCARRETSRLPTGVC